MNIGDIVIDLTPKGREALRMHKAEMNRYAAKRQLSIRKRDLLATDPTCCFCGRLLREGAGEVDSAILVEDRLACRQHVDAVREFVIATRLNPLLTQASSCKSLRRRCISAISIVN